MYDPIYPDGEEVKLGKTSIGEVYPCEVGWGFYVSRLDFGGDGLDDKISAIKCLVQDHINRPDTSQQISCGDSLYRFRRDKLVLIPDQWAKVCMHSGTKRRRRKKKVMKKNRHKSSRRRSNMRSG